jgi:2-iminobutanoate/2-iminopropanoate deaminase
MRGQINKEKTIQSSGKIETAGKGAAIILFPGSFLAYKDEEVNGVARGPIKPSDTGGGMKKQAIVSSRLSKPVGVFSHAVKAEGKGFLFISGLTARDINGNIVGKGDMKTQTGQVLENMKIILEEGGVSFAHIVKVTVYVTDLKYFKDVHEVRAQYFKKDLPASTLVQVSRLVNEDCMIEIDAIAVLG